MNSFIRNVWRSLEIFSNDEMSRDETSCNISPSDYLTLLEATVIAQQFRKRLYASCSSERFILPFKYTVCRVNVQRDRAALFLVDVLSPISNLRLRQLFDSTVVRYIYCIVRRSAPQPIKYSKKSTRLLKFMVLYFFSITSLSGISRITARRMAFLKYRYSGCCRICNEINQFRIFFMQCIFI